ncbi:hypothetical protein GEMRC1_005918 [Eukaryota sp. GEM-RC1]
MSFSLPPAETLSIILDEPSLCNQTISFDEESIEVNKSVLAAHSSYFRSLWFLEFGDKLENPIDYSHLPVDSDNFFAFLKSFFGKSFTFNENNAYNFFYLAHYFQVKKLIDHVENHLNTHLVTWAWLKPFIKEADERSDLRALQFVGPFFSKIDDLVIDDVMEITTEGFQMLSKYCTSTQSQSWFIKSVVESILNRSFDLTEFLTVLNFCSIEAFSFQQWDEFLFVPLKDVEELETDLMKFLFTRVKNLYFDSLVKEVSDLKENISCLNTHNFELTSTITDLESHQSDLNRLTADLTTENLSLKTKVSALLNQNSDLELENSALATTVSNLKETTSELFEKIAHLDSENTNLKQEVEEFKSHTIATVKPIEFSQTRKHSRLEVSDDGKRVVGSGMCSKQILGEDPLLPGNEYTWKLRYQGSTMHLIVGVIDEWSFVLTKIVLRMLTAF